MLKRDVIDYWGSQTKAASRCGCHKTIVNSWGDIVPECVATKMHCLTDGALKYDEDLYKRIKREKAAS